jgi:hypothetical protein
MDEICSIHAGAERQKTLAEKPDNQFRSVNFNGTVTLEWILQKEGMRRICI